MYLKKSQVTTSCNKLFASACRKLQQAAGENSKLLQQIKTSDGESATILKINSTLTVSFCELLIWNFLESSISSSVNTIISIFTKYDCENFQN